MVYLTWPLLWFPAVVEKIVAKHHVTTEEVEEVVFGRRSSPFCRRGRGGTLLVTGKTGSGRSIVIVLKKAQGPGRYRVVTARALNR